MAKKRNKKIKVKVEEKGLNPTDFLKMRNQLNKIDEEDYANDEENYEEETFNEEENDEIDKDKEENNPEEEKNKEESIDEPDDETSKESDEENSDYNSKENFSPDSDRQDLLERGSPDNNSTIPSENVLENSSIQEGEDELAIKSLRRNEEAVSNVEATEDMNKKVTKVKSFLSFIGKLLINPLFWMAIAIICIGIYVSSVFLIIGQNDYNILCDNMGVGSLMLDPNADSFTRQAAIVSWFTSTPFEIMNGQPLTREQAIGIMGNLMQESYGANPKAIQNDHSITKWETCDNQCVLSWGNKGGKAIGIIQWDTGRRQELVRFAMSEGTQWHDLNTQLKFLKQEMDSGYEYQQLVKGGFNDPTKSMEDYVRIWNQYFERSAAAWGDGNNIRITYAQAFSNEYVGGGASVAGGLANFCIGGMQGVDTSNLIQLAIASAWPDKADSRGSCSADINCGQSFAMSAYKEIKILAEEKSTKDPLPGLLASCDRYVATMYRAAGKDINFPWGGANIQGSYMKSSPKWVEVSCQDRQPGDVLWRNGHVMLYLGAVNGRDSIGSASYRSRTGGISGVSCSGNLFVADGDTATGFRMVNN